MVTINAKNIELFKNLAQFEFDNIYYDFHNDFDCTKISLINNCIILLLKHTINNSIVELKFLNAEIFKLDFEFNIENNVLTLDNFYRGRFESNGELMEFNTEQKSFYYLEFYEGQTFELFCEAIEIVQLSPTGAGMR